MHAIRSSSRSPLLPLAAFAVGSGLTAQVPPVHFLGGASNSSVAELVVFTDCTPPVGICVPTNVLPAGAAGGTAYDPVNQLHWHTNGVTLESSLDTSCDFSCFGPSPVANASGLAFDARTQSLWILGLAPELVRTAVPRGGTCPPVQSQCSLASVIPTGLVAAGLALSEKHDLIFYSASAGGRAPINIVFVAPLTAPCQPICRIDLGPAFGPGQTEPITGLAFDDCSDELFAVAGNAGIARTRVAFPGCTAGAVSLCAPTGGYRFHGLCLEPPPATVIGRSCASAPCPTSCSTRLRSNAASIGNQGFALTVGSAPSPSVGIPIMGLGTCTPGLPALCGTFFPGPSRLVVLPPVVTTGPSPCTGGGAVPLPLPADPTLCGASLCFQVLIVCTSGGLGITNALEVVVTGA